MHLNPIKWLSVYLNYAGGIKGKQNKTKSSYLRPAYADEMFIGWVFAMFIYSVRPLELILFK